MKWIIGGIVLIGILLVLIEYSRKREGVSSSPVPQTLEIPPFFKGINKCDYPILWRIGEAYDNNFDLFVKNASEASERLCNSSNPSNITNQKEVCGYITDLSNAYSGKIMDTCPQNPKYDGDRLNTVSVCSLPNYYTGYKKLLLSDQKMDQQRVEQSETAFFDQLKKQCSEGGKNACIMEMRLKVFYLHIVQHPRQSLQKWLPEKLHFNSLLGIWAISPIFQTLIYGGHSMIYELFYSSRGLIFFMKKMINAIYLSNYRTI